MNGPRDLSRLFCQTVLMLTCTNLNMKAWEELCASTKLCINLEDNLQPLMPNADSMKASKQFSITGIMKDLFLPAHLKLTLAHTKTLFLSLLKLQMQMVKTSKLQ